LEAHTVRPTSEQENIGYKIIWRLNSAFGTLESPAGFFYTVTRGPTDYVRQTLLREFLEWSIPDEQRFKRKGASVDWNIRITPPFVDEVDSAG
jgi:hypothetical protein